MSNEKFSAVSLGNYIPGDIRVFKFNLFLSHDDNFCVDVDLCWHAGSHNDGAGGIFLVCSLAETKKNGWSFLYECLCSKYDIRISKELFYEKVVMNNKSCFE